jgi:hypothetical protein
VIEAKFAMASGNSNKSSALFSEKEDFRLWKRKMKN